MWLIGPDSQHLNIQEPCLAKLKDALQIGGIDCQVLQPVGEDLVVLLGVGVGFLKFWGYLGEIPAVRILPKPSLIGMHSQRNKSIATIQHQIVIL